MKIEITRLKQDLKSVSQKQKLEIDLIKRHIGLINQPPSNVPTECFYYA